MPNLHTEKVVGQRIYFRHMENAFDPVDRNEEFLPCIVDDVLDYGDSYRLRLPGMRGILKPRWTAKWTECFSGRDILYRADMYIDYQRIRCALPSPIARALYRWYELGGFFTFELLVTRRIAD